MHYRQGGRRVPSMAESSASSEQLESFGRALTAALLSKGLTSGALLAITNATTTEGARGSVSKWMNGIVEPSRPKVLAMEAAIGLEPGTLSRHLGWLPVGARELPSAEEAILTDPDLTAAQKNILLAALEDFRSR